jgi:drug/metabolite transporter (DMT)-like permease
MNLLLAASPLLIPLLAVAVVLIGRRTDEDEKAAGALGIVAFLGAFIAFSQHTAFNGYTMAIMCGITGIALVGYVVYRRKQAY